MEDMNDNELENANDDELFDLLDKIDYEDLDDKEDDPSKDKPYEQLFCYKCKSSDKIAEDTSNGIVVCMECGNTIAQIFDSNPEWKNYADGKSGSARCNAASNYFLPQSSLGTTIGGSNRSKVKLIHSWNAMPYKERSLNNELKQIQGICRQAGILKCIEDDAKIYYKILSDTKHLTGKNQGKFIIIRGIKRTSLKGACVYYACKRKGDSRSPKEIAKLFSVRYKDITKGCKTFKKLMKLHQIPYDAHVNDPEHFIKRYCRDLHIAKNYVTDIMKIVKNIEKLDLISAHTPPSIAIGSILLVVDMNKIDIDRKMVATKFELSEATIDKACKRIEQYKNILINDELTEKIAKIIKTDKTNNKVPDKLKIIYLLFQNKKKNHMMNLLTILKKLIKIM